MFVVKHKGAYELMSMQKLAFQPGANREERGVTYLRDGVRCGMFLTGVPSGIRRPASFTYRDILCSRE